jgi:effector-binding domain-containing protein
MTETAEPTIVTRAAQPCVGIRASVTMAKLAQVADLIPEVEQWLAERGVAPAGAPYFRYHLIDMADELDVEVGFPVAAAPPGEGRIAAGELPGGRYATVRHVGPPDTLLGATAALLTWADRQGLDWDKVDTPAGERWGCRLEIYHTDPAEEPDPSRWETELAFRLVG